MNSRPDLIIIGTGPAGVAAAWPIAESGANVLFLEAGGSNSPPSHSLTRPPLQTLRQSMDGWRYLLGKDFVHAKNAGSGSPKLRLLVDARPSAYAESNQIEVKDFTLIGAQLTGGLSNIWGAVTCAYGERELSEWPIELKDLLNGYRKIATRIGISGPADSPCAVAGVDIELQNALQLGNKAKHVLEKYRMSGRKESFSLGVPWNAVLSKAHNNRRACDLNQACMLGCPTGAVYSSKTDLDELLRTHKNIEIEYGFCAEHVGSNKQGGWCVEGRTGQGGVKRFSAPKVLLAAGAAASARLGLQALGINNQEQPFYSTPCFGFAAILLQFIDRPAEVSGFGMAQLAFEFDVPGPQAVTAFGTLYDASAFSIADLGASLPLTRQGALSLMGMLSPSLMAGLVYLPSRFTASKINLKSDGTLCIVGGENPALQQLVKSMQRELSKQLWKCGAWLVPGSMKQFDLGAEVHYAGGLSMGKVSDCDGRLAEGLYAIDGAALPALPARHHTFTLMANAHRIGAKIFETQ